ncbi:Hsp20/alpha crystallin family protein [Zavarzinia sp. CC-PAN008]|uniref:Hsp20/alpha crystallin family protein n=1 Tax=Zavarzinia sp. CC-PAN008 TaxID=3243332 RepID=UPI003F7479D3
MWAEACAFLDRAEQMQRQFFKPAGQRPGPVWEPPLDVVETDQGLAIIVALPGVDPQAVQVRYERGQLIVEAERRLPVNPQAARIHRLEIPYGRFERRIGVPAGEWELGRTQLVNGCLVLTLARVSGRAG